jgi:signal transduction histidine kinase
MASSEPTYPVPEHEEERLADLHSYGILDTAPEPTYDDLVLLAAKVCDRPMAAITFVDEHRQWVKAEVGGGAKTVDRAESFCAQAIADPDEVYVAEDASDHPALEDNPYVRGDPKIRFYAGAPIKSYRGHGLGTICVMDTEPGELTADELAALEALSRTVTLQLELRRHGQRWRRAQRDMELFAAAVGSDVREGVDVVQTALQTLADHGADLDEAARSDLQAGKKASRQLATTLTSLEEYVQVAGSGEAMEAVPLSDALEEAQSRLEAREDPRSQVQAHGLPVVWGDRRQLTAVFAKLVKLASEAGDPEAPIHVSAHRGKDRWRIRLSTEADGVPEARWQAWQQALADDEPEPPEGSAWDLVLCRRIVDRHGGELGIEGPPGEGLEAWFTLPGPDEEPTPSS